MSTNAIKPQQWQDLPNGSWLQEAVEDKLASWWPKVFGYHLLSMGPLSASLEKPNLPIGREFSMVQQGDASLIGSYCNLPVQNGVIDAAVCSLLLDFELDPYRVLRETDRVLISGGYLFIIGFNPLSPAFIGKLLPKYQEQLPWCGRFFTPARVKDWLGLLGYQVIGDERLVYHHLLSNIYDESIWQHALQAWLPGSGSLYIIVARKLDTPLTPILDKQRVRRPNWSTAPTAGRTGHLRSHANKKEII
ncbi:class I SAM-dependent methyltransferase [Shewanella mesophila]|uniref:class I SAM-dependent methyltransferase n=1 Tax=Shewanella mesophila TaxID=2864208 RepID=UPI001C658F78|nr:methyltransferase domain-containing protein [Shewanella mesophila]QYJ84626.1 class I SAM-dependent methyltransferase [Shewanella mesophila]